ncbi:MAG: acetate--CoA ligase family protein, partial [Pseudomonadota bacterium]
MQDLSNPSALARLLAPKSIAFIGGAEAEVALRGTLNLGFEGKIFAVHPKREHLAGVPTMPTLGDLPEVPEAAFIAVRREPSIELVRELAARGTAGAVVYASGFAEVGEEGVKLQAELLEAAGSMALIGPNCYGIVNYLDRLSPWPDIFGGTAVDRGVAVITQSGSMALNFTLAAHRLPMGAMCALGNQAQIGMAEMLAHFAADERVTAIGLHIEGLTDVAEFAEAASLARTLRKPVIALKTGRSEQGARTTRSHTNSLSGADDLYSALFDRYGIARVNTMSAFTETLNLLHHGGPISGHNLLSMSCSGGEAALAADLSEPMKLQTPPLPEHSKKAMVKALNEFVQLENPLDYHTFIWGNEEKLTACYAGAMSGGFDVSMLMIDTPNETGLDRASWTPSIDAYITAAAETGCRAAVAIHLPESMPADLEAQLSAHGVAVLRGLQDALDAIEAAADIGANWQRTSPLPVLDAAPMPPGGLRQLTEHAAKQRLATHGLTVPEGQVCKVLEAPDVAEAIGWPVTLKLSDAALAHKSDVGGIALNLQNRAEVADAAARLGHLGDSVLVEKMIAGA